ncbi:hypothetical protein [Sulfurimonas sp.]
MKLLYMLILVFSFNACDLLESKDAKAAKIAQEKAAFEQKITDTKEVQLKQIDAQTQRELAKIKTQKALAEIQKEQMIEKIRLQGEVQKQKIELEQKRAKIALDAKMLQEQQANAMEIKRYLLAILFLMLIIISFFLYYYFKKRHEDKLRAYQDNLDKYFHQQENMTKMRIAEKIIDTVATGKLDKEQELELIRALNATNTSPRQETKLLSEENNEIEIIEPNKDTN